MLGWEVLAGVEVFLCLVLLGQQMGLPQSIPLPLLHCHTTAHTTSEFEPQACASEPVSPSGNREFSIELLAGIVERFVTLLVKALCQAWGQLRQ